jgi:hypothetical protein
VPALPVPEVIAAYLKATGPFTPDPAPVWTFSHIPGAEALFYTSAKATALLPRETFPTIRAIGHSEAGFAMVQFALPGPARPTLSPARKTRAI